MTIITSDHLVLWEIEVPKNSLIRSPFQQNSLLLTCPNNWGGGQFYSLSLLLGETEIGGGYIMSYHCLGMFLS